MEKIKNDLKNICLEIIQSTDYNTEEWLEKTSKIYENLLVLDYLENRDKALKNLGNKVKETLLNIETKSVQVELPDITKEPSTNKLTSEVKVLPPPEGPPTSQKDIEESIIEIQKEEERKTKAKAKQVIQTVIEVEEPIKEKPKVEVESKKVKEPVTPPPTKPKKQSIAEKAEATAQKKSLNEKLTQSTLKIGLNDRIAFVKHLFNQSQEDFNRVLSQVNSFEELSEAEQFIEHIVKPEYGWSNKEEYEERFMELIRSKF